jgi:phage-related baseplate assembly protein
LTAQNLELLSTDADTVLNEMIDTVEQTMKITLAPASPERLFVMSLASIFVQLRVLINDKLKQNLLRYARDEVLDDLGDRVETPRIGAQPATVTVRFTLSAPQQTIYTVPQGKRVSPDGNLFFETAAAGQIQPGQTYVDILCECLTPGEIGNGYVPGQINILVDPLPYIASISNTTTSSGGAEVEADDPYRERIRTAPESFSVAGPEGAYIFWAKSADSTIVDVSVDSPSDGVIEIRPLVAGGNLPSQAVLDAVAAKLSDKKVRPLTDKVQVLAPDEVTYAIDVQYWIDKEDEANEADIQAAVNAAVADYQLWQRSKLGRDINPDELRRRMLLAGAKRTQVNSPVFRTLDKTQKATETTVTVTYGGIEDA